MEFSQVNNLRIMDQTRVKLLLVQGLVYGISQNIWHQKGWPNALVIKVQERPTFVSHLETDIFMNIWTGLQLQPSQIVLVLGKRKYHCTQPPTKGMKGKG